MYESTDRDKRPEPSKPTAARLALLLATGVILTAASNMRWGIGAFAWFAPVPFLYVLLKTNSRRATAAVFGATLLATHLTIAKIITPPLSYFFIPMFAIPAALISFIPMAVWITIRRRVGIVTGIYTYPATVVVAMWAQYALTELGTWSAPAYTQIDNLALMQSASVFGLSGLNFVMSLGAVILAEWAYSGELRPLKKHAYALVSVIAVFYVFGTIRMSAIQDGPTVKAAAVSTDLVFSKLAAPDRGVLKKTNDTLFERTEIAAKRGARVVVWNEVATLMEPSDEAAFVERGIETAKTNAIDIVLSYGVVLSSDPVKIENKYKFIRNNGTIAQTYLKHHPVPGEPSVKGTDALAAIETDYGAVAGALCYDYDFPSMSLTHANLGIGLAVVPSSDWLGIHPFHTQMAGIRGIEGGFSVLRSTRNNISAGYDAYGRVRGQLDYYENNDRIMMVTLPVKHVPTVYAAVGDALPYACIVFLSGAVAYAVYFPANRTNRVKRLNEIRI